MWVTTKYYILFILNFVFFIMFGLLIANDIQFYWIPLVLLFINSIAFGTSRCPKCGALLMWNEKLLMFVPFLPDNCRRCDYEIE